MKSTIFLAATLILLGCSAAPLVAQEESVEQRLAETTAKIDANRQAGKISVKQSTNLHSEAKILSNKIEETKSKNQGLLSEGDKVKFGNKVKALDVKVASTANPKRTSDEKSLATIRKAIMKQKGFSTEAQNVKLSFEDGVLVLDGSVKNEKEKEDLINVAKNAGASQVNSKLSVVQ
ncbi:BON domain-containing protein [Candidatus Obscuribacterales bacterium]|nr:BON domain-containing protein [Candidatus Obscuribacterales bacterium]